jgi:hypothetical protein
MVIIIYKLPIGSFTFLQCLSGTELLNLSRPPYILTVLLPYIAKVQSNLELENESAVVLMDNSSGHMHHDT